MSLERSVLTPNRSHRKSLLIVGGELVIIGNLELRNSIAI